MQTAELMPFIDQIDRFAELAELPADEGLCIDSLALAQFWADVELLQGEADDLSM